MKSIWIVLTLIFGQVLLAQKLDRFYFEPIINTKTTFIYKHDYSSPIENEFFKLVPYKRITPLSGGAGFNFGYKLKNNNLIQIGVFRESTTSGFEFIGKEVKQYPMRITNISDIKYHHYGGVLINNFNLLYKNELFRLNYKKVASDNFISFNLVLGLSFMHKPLNGIENLTGENSFSFYSYDSTKITLSESVKVFPLPHKRSFKTNTGIELTIGKNNKELFNIGVYYGANFNSLNFFSFNVVNVTVTDKNQNNTYYNLQVQSRANGLYYQVSKRFYPFKWYLDRQKKKLTELKEKQNL
ncbi:MAG: hypothetical protein ACK5QC_02910 [Bacteroidota bacterium]